MKNRILFTILLNIFIATYLIFPGASFSADTNNITTDQSQHARYEQYLKYEKYKLYKKYKKAKEKYGFENSAKRRTAKARYKKYKKYKKNKSKYPEYTKYYEDYKDYKKYKKYYVPVRDYKKYGKYKKYNKNRYKKYGKKKYVHSHKRYKEYLKGERSYATNSGHTNGHAKKEFNLKEANLGGGPLGPEIAVGLWYYTRDSINETPFKIEANKAYNVKNEKGEVIVQVPAGDTTRVSHDHKGDLAVYGSVAETLSKKVVSFDAADGNNNDLIFDVHRPASDFDQYRGKIKLKYHTPTKNIWVINTLPLEHYTWGMGEITGTGTQAFNQVMTTSFRTYGYWKVKYSTKYANEGFQVNATPGNQLYYGYDWENSHSTIRTAAQATQGHIVIYYKGDIAITPYSSWTDGRTRSFEERWGSKKYPWCQSVADPYGKHPGKPTQQLENEGNHMVGLSANGAVVLARDHGWSWTQILEYYFQDAKAFKVY
ncbi:hypothetical protein ACFL2R_00530 [Patescibacteria group bacterium]